MIDRTASHSRVFRGTALLISLSMAAPLLAGCGGKDNSAIPPPVDDTRGGAMSAPANRGGAMASNPATAAPQRTGMTTKQKVVLLGGAALLYYLYKRHQKQQNQEVQYYLSKNGQVYYRDPQTHQAHFVTPQKVTLDDQESQEISRYRGYNNSTSGDTYNPQTDAAGAQ